MTFKTYKDKRGKYRWSLVTDNNKIIACSGEGYNNKKDCIDMIHNIMTNASNCKVAMTKTKPVAK